MLADRDYEVIAEAVDGTFAVERGLGLLPLWLGAASDRRDGEPDLLGRRTLRGTVRADRSGLDVDGRPLGPAEPVLTVDLAGAPVRVEVTTAVPDPPLSSRSTWPGSAARSSRPCPAGASRRA